MIINFSNLGGGGGGEYVLPKASETRLGGIKVGENLSIDANGVLSAQGSSGEGGDYKIVDSLPESAQTGEMIYLTQEQTEYETKGIISGMVFDISEITEYTTLVAGYSSWYGETVLNWAWNGSDAIIDGGYGDPGGVTDGETKILYWDTLGKVMKLDGNKAYLGLLDTEIPEGQVTAVTAEVATLEEPFTSVEVQVASYAPGNYIYKNGAWTAFEVPVKNAATLNVNSFTEADWDKVAAAYENGEPYDIFGKYSNEDLHYTITEYYADLAFRLSTVTATRDAKVHLAQYDLYKNGVFSREVSEEIGGGGGYQMTSLTQAEYDALEEKDNNTLYLIVG